MPSSLLVLIFSMWYLFVLGLPLHIPWLLSFDGDWFYMTDHVRLIMYKFVLTHFNNQGHPTTGFCKISVRRSKCCLEFSIAWGRFKIYRWLFHSCTIFEAYLFPTINSLHFTAQVRLFFVQKRNLKFSD